MGPNGIQRPPAPEVRRKDLRGKQKKNKKTKEIGNEEVRIKILNQVRDYQGYFDEIYVRVSRKESQKLANLVGD